MSKSPSQRAIVTTACVAFRHIDTVIESEREAVLVALVEVLPEAEAELAERMLFHLREQRKHQMELAGILNRRRKTENGVHHG